ncbi:transferase [Chaetomium fimeti]|uniref:Transferase n=1 Tax=Chaetomium fimeti TaxID=1854472 RepID=A0AAE0LP43_9PEZI|nr:transferase [Chaetomium fimeti]
MPKTEEYQFRPLGWENDPEVERLRFSSLDYLAACTYNSYALFFKLEDEERPGTLAALKEGLERTLAQCRQLVGTIEKNDDDDDHSFVKKRDSTVRLVVKYFEAEDNVPSMSEIEKAHFASSSLGDTGRFVVEGMTYGEKPECFPSAKPVVSAYQANFIPGGFLFMINLHHYANDVMGWANFVYQLADNCNSIVNKTAPPSWDPANLDASRFTASEFPSESKVDGPTSPERHPLLREHAALLFHLPKSKAKELKGLATRAGEGQMVPWVSTYDAFSALLWRVITRHRATLYNSSPDETPIFIEGINMRTRTDPPVANRLQRNLFWAAVSANYPNPLAIKEIASLGDVVPLSLLASKIRTMTNSMDQAGLDKALAMLAPVRDKTCLFSRVDSFPPLTVVITDWRLAAVCEKADFGFGRPSAFRHFLDAVSEGLITVYPPRMFGSDTDEGCEFVVTMENEIVEAVLDDSDLKKYFEFRGYEVKRAAKTSPESA